MNIIEIKRNIYDIYYVVKDLYNDFYVYQDGDYNEDDIKEINNLLLHLEEYIKELKESVDYE